MDSSAESENEPPFPSRLKTVQQLREAPLGDIPNYAFVSTIGVVKSYLPPAKTNGEDLKSIITIADSNGWLIDIIIFKREERLMPRPSATGQVILIRNAKLKRPSVRDQETRGKGETNLVVHSSTEYHFLTSPTSSNGREKPWRTLPAILNQPTSVETSYAIWLSQQTVQSQLPVSSEIIKVSSRSSARLDKFSLLKDVEPGKWYNLLGQIVKIHDSAGHITVYLSDYTPHKNFFNYLANSSEGIEEGQDGDVYGYTSRINNVKIVKEWPGPYGKMCLQVTMFEPHANYVRENVKEDNWVLLNNVELRFGKQGALLEGYMRTEGRPKVQILSPSSTSDTRLKEAIKRKLEWWTKHNAKRRSDKEVLTVQKRRPGDEPKLNAKKRRMLARAQAAKNAAQKDMKIAGQLNSNANITSNFPSMPISSLQEILKHERLETMPEKVVAAPFTNKKYKAHVRVIDYFPRLIEDFAIGHRVSEYDVLSDYSCGEDSDQDDDMRSSQAGEGSIKRSWEWRFALKVQDAACQDSKDYLWLMVDNHAAQGLLGLREDADDLRQNSTLLSNLKAQLFQLWGELEEIKAAALALEMAERQGSLQPSVPSPISSSPAYVVGLQPDADSDDDIAEVRSPEKGDKTEDTKSKSMTPMNQTVKNKAFTCCIQQYGVKIGVDDPTKANAGEGLRWQRRFGLFGTQIN